MNVFNCHVNRAPVSGRILRIAYRPGKFLNAELDKASDDNERNGVVIDTSHGKVGVVQIAGLVARRIVCFSREDETLTAVSVSDSSASARGWMSICPTAMSRSLPKGRPRSRANP